MNAPLFTIVMPSFLGHYPTAAKNRDQKIHRAVSSVITQSFKDWELLIISDGCDTTFSMIEARYSDQEKINCIQIPKQPLFSGTPRNVGISKAKGRYIVYLDIDDYFGKDHLSIIEKGLRSNNYPDWVWFDDYEGRKGTPPQFVKMERNIHKRGSHGTCNLCHKKDVTYWNEKGTYLHDFEFALNLKRSSQDVIKIDCPQYYICHIPNRIDI